MPNFCSITICGHLGRDASTKDVGDTTVTDFSIAVSHKVKGERVTTWYRCTLWGSRGEKLAPSLTKGSAIIVSGALEPREYKGKDGSDKLSLEIRVDQLGFAGGGAGEGRDAQPQSKSAPAPAPSSAGYDDDPNEIPF